MNPKSVSEDELIGKKLDDVRDLYPDMCIRIVMMDGKEVPIISSIAFNRINVAVKNNIIVELYGYY